MAHAVSLAIAILIAACSEFDVPREGQGSTMMDILIVEDQPDIQEVISLNLEHAGYRALRADTVREVEAIVNAALPDLVLLDWMLPDTPGLSYLRRNQDCM